MSEISGSSWEQRLRTLATFGGTLYKLNEHFKRLQESLELTQLKPSISLTELMDSATKLVTHNHQFLPTGSDLGLAVLVTPGISCQIAQYDVCRRITISTDGTLVRGRRITWLVTIARSPAMLASSTQMPKPYALLPSGPAGKANSDSARALMLDQLGNVAEASTANILI